MTEQAGRWSGHEESAGEVGQCSGGAAYADGHVGIWKVFREKISQSMRNGDHAV